MNATKRKFNALLNGIGNKSTISLPSNDNIAAAAADDIDAQAKKRRLAPLAVSNSHSNTKSSSSSLVPKSFSTSAMPHKKATSLATAAVESPKYAPWDRTAFLQRLKSFSNITDWTPKPSKVNEVEWAKRGWVCRGLERVRCCSCHVEILVKLNRKEVDGKEEAVYMAQNIEDALVDRYVELIITSHDEDCLWRKRGCDESIFRLPLNHAPTTLQSLREHYDELCVRKDTLPYPFNIRTPTSFDLAKTMAYLPSNFFASPDPVCTSPSNSADGAPPSQPINTVALQLALFGWTGHTHSQTNARLGPQLDSISCNSCFRILGLWLFKSKKVDTETGEEVQKAVVDCLDVVDEHREYCPWKNAASQNGGLKGGKLELAGWEIVGRVLSNDFYLRNGDGHGKSGSGSVNGRPVTAGGRTDGDILEGVDGDADTGDTNVDEDASRDAKDKERWARLRRVKSLFDTKSGRKGYRATASTTNVRKAGS